MVNDIRCFRLRRLTRAPMVLRGDPAARRQDKAAVMLRWMRVGVIAGAALLGGCSTSGMPSWNLGSIGSTFSGSTNVSLTIESDPPGADARTSIGPACRTPCMIPVPADREFTVTYTLNGYLPRTVPVVPRQPDPTRMEVEAGGAVPVVDLAPNPVYAQLDPAPPPAPAKRRPVKKKVTPKAAPPPPQ